MPSAATADRVAPLGTAGCQPPSPLDAAPPQGLPEAQGTTASWQRPGQEWGSGFTFPVAGCWDLHATRGTSSGDVWLVVQ